MRARIETVNTDGTPLHASDYDKRYEHETAQLLAKAWNCEVRPVGPLCPIDYYALRDGRLVGLIEIKRRYHPVGTYPTVYLNLRKWLALQLAALSGGAPVFVVRWDDETRYIDVREVDASKITVGGETAVIKSHTDIEPVILVPVANMKIVT